jgi:tripartite-type tricarboxylate transporter receptor subunit TctC
LGVSTAARIGLAPEIPSISEAGVKGYEMSFWFAAYVPAGTPTPVISRLHDILARANKSPSVSAFLGQNGFEALAGSPEDLRKFQAAESDKWKKIITSSGIEKE